jgi:sedoheptulose-bisphosphatase
MEEETTILIEAIQSAVVRISDLLQQNELLSTKTGTHNGFGDEQLHVDVLTNRIIFEHLVSSGVVQFASSEEEEELRPCDGTTFWVAFDPLDGSSVVDCNFTVGTVFGVWRDGIVGKTGRDQVFSVMALYGPTTKLVFGMPGNGAYEMELINSTWTESRRFYIHPITTYFAPANLRAASELKWYRKLVDYWIDNKYTLRYSGALVPDVYHILVKGNGIYISPVSTNHKAKLRLTFEVAPIALIVDLAGGISCNPITGTSVLDVQINEMDQRIGAIFGSIDEVKRSKTFLGCP